MLLMTNIVIIVIIAMDAHMSTKLRRISSRLSGLKRTHGMGSIQAFDNVSLIEMVNPLIRINQRTGSVRAPTGKQAHKTVAVIDVTGQRTGVQPVALSERSRRFLDARSSVNSSIDNFELDESDGEEAPAFNYGDGEAHAHKKNGSDNERGPEEDGPRAHAEEAADVASPV
jgi:hypothetical protein